MDGGMGNALLIEKWDKSNYAYLEYKMHQYLLVNGSTSYIVGENEVAPKPIQELFGLGAGSM